eukprot:TRINITY_DN38930_c0_g1_i1.p1 TRINITY_DN38930_c0_g1~~TRINITY_DN38930_c0_g1_i1.p1  ORF type:complete len:628 (+),score=159.63 TRINITY_DN38930_c0_g1_i1:84-1967(+)
MAVAATDATQAELWRLLEEAQLENGASLLGEWSGLPPQEEASPQLALTTLQALCAAVKSAGIESCGASAFDDETVLALLCTRLAAIDAALARAGPGVAAESAAFLFVNIEGVTNLLAVHCAMRLLQPLRNLSAGPRLRTEALRLPLVLLARCQGADSITAPVLLSLARGDLAVAVGIAVAAVENPGVPAVPGLRLQLWQCLYQMSTPQGAAELLETQQGLSDGNDTPIHDLLTLHVAQAHWLALCLVQFDAITVTCGAAATADTQQRAALLAACLRCVHNLVASPYLWAPGRVLGRQLAGVLWPRFGFRLLAPHLRRLLQNAEGALSAGKARAASMQAARDLRRDLRTVGWLLHHSPELREQMRPLCGELAMKAARANHAPETLALAVGIAANAAALLPDSPVYRALDMVDCDRKQAVRLTFPSETNRLWINADSWAVVEQLGFWPVEESEADARAADEAAIVKLDPFGGASWDHIVDPGYEQDDEDWGDGDDWAQYSEDDDEDDLGYADEEVEAQGPLGLLEVPPPQPPTRRLVLETCIMEAPTTLLCAAPGEFRCAIDGRFCREPVRSEGGILYERASIVAFLAWKAVCPVTGCALTADELHEETAVADSAAAWLLNATCPQPIG